MSGASSGNRDPSVRSRPKYRTHLHELHGPHGPIDDFSVAVLPDRGLQSATIQSRHPRSVIDGGVLANSICHRLRRRAGIVWDGVGTEGGPIRPTLWNEAFAKTRVRYLKNEPSGAGRQCVSMTGHSVHRETRIMWRLGEEPNGVAFVGGRFPTVK